MLFTSVDVEALRYFYAKGETTGKVIEDLRGHITYGYQTELMYQHRDGWFNAFVDEGGTGSLWLTAFCLSVFSKAREFAVIDESVLGRAADWIVRHQEQDGHWVPIGFVCHKELEGGVSGDYGRTAFVTRALVEYGGAPADALARARTYLETHLAEATDSHSLAVGAYVLTVLKSPVADQALDRLLSISRQDPSGALFWDTVPVETGSYATLAYYERGRSMDASAAARWIADQKNSRGGFGGTQDTVMGLSALVKDALYAGAGTNVDVQIERDGKVIGAARVDSSNFDIVQAFPVESGSGLQVRTSGSGPVKVQLAKLYNMPVEILNSRGGLSLSVTYASTEVDVGSTVQARVEIAYNGTKPETNMAVAEIGIPTGLRPDRAALQALVGAGEIQRIDVSGRSIVVYLDRVVAGETIAIPIVFQAAFTAKSVPAPSTAYDYYDPSVEALDGGIAISVVEASQQNLFVRGDANFDGEIGVADAIRILSYLFASWGPATCIDAYDTNDDGTVNIADPIRLLGYLFAHKEPPAAPFPDRGQDATPDPYECVR